ncbi:SH3 domain-containing protein [Xanthobacter sp. V3C-3]|uniref:SH3 domain-containing protein n=1 Tax=Xanthobacter lutulentifluminis TaxID=3119935 RepID=UPI00372AF9BE
MATQVASILGTGAAAQDAPAPSDTKVASAEPAPTADDFARPAFLEPADGDEADLPEGAAEAAGDAAPLPTPRPAAASAEADKDARTVRIRSAVTLRSGPRRSASAIGTLDEGTRVTLYSCKSWCEVSSGDKRGFVYKTAVAQ